MSDELRHATVLALNEICSWLEFCGSVARWSTVVGYRACDWRPIGGDDSVFAHDAASALLNGVVVVHPTCPACAALLDLALELRGTKEAA